MRANFNVTPRYRARLTNTEIGFVVTIIGHAKSCVVVIFVARDSRFSSVAESAERHNLNIPSRTLVVRLSAGSARERPVSVARVLSGTVLWELGVVPVYAETTSSASVAIG